MSFIEPVMAAMPSATAIDAGDLSSLSGPISGAPLGGGGGGAGSMLGPLSMASTAMSAVGSAIQGVMGFVGGMQQARQAKQAAAQASLISGVNTQEALLQGGSTLGRAATLAAASGGGLGGTTTGVLNQIAGRSYFNARMAAYKGVTQAESDLYMAKVDKDNAINSLIGGFSGSVGQAVAGGLKENFRQSILQSKAYEVGDIDPYAAAQLG